MESYMCAREGFELSPALDIHLACSAGNLLLTSGDEKPPGPFACEAASSLLSRSGRLQAIDQQEPTPSPPPAFAFRSMSRRLIPLPVLGWLILRVTEHVVCTIQHCYVLVCCSTTWQLIRLQSFRTGKQNVESQTWIICAAVPSRTGSSDFWSARSQEA